MRKAIVNSIKNAARARFTSSEHFDPVLPTLYVTPLCNFRCTYCADWGAHKNASFAKEVPSLTKLEQLMRILRAECDVLYFTGGEPLMRADIAQVLAFARQQGFSYLVLNTNGLLLHLRRDIVDHLDNLVISFDGLDEGRDEPHLQQSPKLRQRIVENIQWAAGEQRKRRFVVTLTTVVRPGRVAEAHRVMEFAFRTGVHFSIQHLTVGSRASPELVRDPAFPRFLDAMMEARRNGLPISGSELYLRATRDHVPFACMPTMVPHVDHLGRLAYPCREIEDRVYVDLIKAGSLRSAMAEGAARYGSPPASCSLCPDRCYIETSALLRNPGVLVGELTQYFTQSTRLGQWMNRRDRPLAPA